MSSLNFGHAADFIGEVPRGRWTTYKDVATAANNDRAAQAIGNWIRRHADEIPYFYRVLLLAERRTDLQGYVSSPTRTPTGFERRARDTRGRRRLLRRARSG